MKLLFVLLYLFLDFNKIYCCNKAKPRKPEAVKEVERVIETEFNGTYSTGIQNAQPTCMNLRFIPTVRRTPDFRTTQPCGSIVPGISLMEHGAIKNFFYESFDEVNKQHFEKVMYFTCNTDTGRYKVNFKNYTVPSEMYTVTGITQVINDRRIVSIPTIIMSLDKDTKLIKTESNYLLKLPLLKADIGSITSAGYLSITVYTYEAKLRDDARPNQHVLREYIKLPQNWRDDVNAYYEFVTRFGTHFRDSTKFGGSVFLLVSHSSLQKQLQYMDIANEVTVTSFVNDVAKMKAGQDTRINLHSLGGAGQIQDFQKWISSVPDEPIPLDSRFVPLNEFLDISTSQRSKSLGQFITFESDHQNYKKYSFEIKIANDKNKLSDFFIDMVSNQLQYICSSNYLNSIIENSIERGNNFKLNKFFLKFKTSKIVSENQMKTKYIFKNTIYLIPNVCFTLLEQISTCTEPVFKLPGNVKCIQFFEKENCIGKGTKISQPNGMIELFAKNKIKSIAMCSTV